MITKFFLPFLLCIGLATFAFADDPYADFVAAGVNADFSQSRSLPYVYSNMVLFENVIVGNERYAIIMRWDTSNVLKPIWAGTLSKVEIPFRTITIDGNDADWAGISPVLEDPAGDEDPAYSTVPGTDLANVYLARDDNYLYSRMTFHDNDPILAQYGVELHQYLTQQRTPGDRLAKAFNDGNGWRAGVHDRTGVDIASYPADYVGVGLGMIEWKVNITDMQYPPNTPNPHFNPVPLTQGIENQFVWAYIHPLPSVPDNPVSDQTDALTAPMIVNFYD